MAHSPTVSDVESTFYNEHERLLGEKLNHEATLSLSRRPKTCQCRSSRYKWFHIVAFLTYTLLFLVLVSIGQPWKSQCASCNTKDNGVRPVMESAFRYRREVVDYNFETDTDFKGPRVDEVEAAWQDLLNHPHELRLKAEDIHAANISTVQLADGSGDYIAQPQAYHLLHCVYNLYKYTHLDFYGEDPQGADWRIEHSDHCLDNLRQYVMCHAGGTGVSTYKWLPDHKLPWPVLSADERCIDWDFFDNWVQERSIPIEDIIHQKDRHLLEHPTMGVLSYEDFTPWIS